VSLRALIVLCVSSPAWADRAIAVDVDARAPFAAAELEQALRVRVAASGPSIDVQVRLSDDGDRVIVTARGGSEAVPLGGRAGEDAARLVALVAVDLMFDDLAVAPSPPPRPPSAVAIAAHPVASRPPVTIGVLGAVAQWNGALAGATIDVAVPRGSWILAADLGGGQLVGGGIDLRGAIVRLGGGARVGAIDLRAGLTFVPIDVADGAGDQTILAGAGASARLRIPIAARSNVIVAAGVDAFATHTTYRMDGMDVTSTPWVAPWIAAGMEVAP